MVEFVLGAVAGAVAAVMIPAVYSWVKKQTDSVKDRVDKL